MWDELRDTMDEPGIVEYGIFQRDRKSNSPIWRRHKGARNACYGRASYPKEKYANSGGLLVPYVATWLTGSEFAYLIRASAGDPEVTIVPAVALENIHATDESNLSEQLAAIFADGAKEFGIRLLNERRIRLQ